MAVELSEHEPTVSLRDPIRPTGRLNTLSPFPATITRLRDAMPENDADGLDDTPDNSAYPSADCPADNTGRHLTEVVAGVNAAVAAFATLLDGEGILPKEKVREALSNAWLDMPEHEALGGAGDVFEDVLARLG